jgi:hypothetical protein
VRMRQFAVLAVVLLGTLLFPLHNGQTAPSNSVADWEIVDQAPIPFAVGLEISPDGNILYAIGGSGVSKIDADTLTVLDQIDGVGGEFHRPALTPDGRYLLGPDDWHGLFFLDPVTLDPLHKVGERYVSNCWNAVVTSDSHRVICADTAPWPEAWIRFYDLDADPPVEAGATGPFDGTIKALDITPDDSEIYAVDPGWWTSPGRRVYVIDVATMQLVTTITTDRQVLDVEMDSTRNLAYISSSVDGGGITVIDLATRTIQDIWEIGPVRRMTYDPLNDILVAVDQDEPNKIHFISPVTGEIVGSKLLPAPGRIPYGMEFSPDGTRLYVAVKEPNATPGITTSAGMLFVLGGPNQPPNADADGPYEATEGGSVVLGASGSSDPDGDTLSYAWDLDNDGSFETSGQTPTFSAAGRDGPDSQTVGLQVCDDSGACDTASATVNILNVAPAADAGADQTVYRGDEVTLTGTWSDPMGSVDDPYSWEWDLDGDGSPDSSSTAACGDTITEVVSFEDAGTYTLTFTVTDKDGGVGTDSVVVEVLNQPPDCSEAMPSVDTLWPPNHEFEAVDVLGVTDPDGDAISLTIDSIFQDEAVDIEGSGDTGPDGQGVGTSTVEVRAERAGLGNGRVYHIGFAADDGRGGVCTGEVLVSVPKSQDKNDVPVDDGALYDSTSASS